MQDVLRYFGLSRPKPKNNRIRLWNMGSLEHKIMPTQQGIDKLAEVLLQNPTDIIWGPALTCTVLEGPEAVDVIQSIDGKQRIIVGGK
jgi:hypothetical protein